MTASLPPTSQIDVKGLRRLGVGAGLGLAGGVLALVIPVTFLLLTIYNPGGFFVYAPSLLQATSILLLAGALLFLLSLLVYRLGFGLLRRVEPRFTMATALCLVGSLGSILLVVAAAFVLGNASSLLTCIHGQPSHALSCLRSGEPLGAYTGLAGFALAWIGGIGLVSGLSLAGRRYHQGSIRSGAGLYGVLLIVLVGPLVSLLYSFPGSRWTLVAAPIFILLAPGLVLGGVVRHASVVS